MAVEDGAVLGKLLGLHEKSGRTSSTPSVLALYESLRKHRTTLNVQGANENRKLYHMVPEDVTKQRRDEQLAELQWGEESNSFPWSWGRYSYLKDLLGFDSIANAEQEFQDFQKSSR